MKVVRRMSGGFVTSEAPVIVRRTRGTGIGWAKGVGQAGLAAKPADLALLAIGPRVHRIDDDGTGARALCDRAGADARVGDRHEEAHRFARTGADGNDRAFQVPGGANGLNLVAVEGEGLVVAAEDLARFRMSCGSRLADRLARLRSDGERTGLQATGRLAGPGRREGVDTGQSPRNRDIAGFSCAKGRCPPTQ